MKRTAIKRGDKPLTRTAPLASRGARARANGIAVPKRRAVSPASPAQRAKVRDLACIVCAGAMCGDAPCHPAHLIDRSLTTVGQDEALAVVPLGPFCHRAYDEEALDLLPHLEPAWRAELAFAVSRVGLLTTYRRVTNTREAPEDR